MSDVEVIERLTEAIGCLDGRPIEWLQKLAELARAAVGATGVTLSVQGAGATAGKAVTKAVLAIPLPCEAPPPVAGASGGMLGKCALAQGTFRRTAGTCKRIVRKLPRRDAACPHLPPRGDTGFIGLQHGRHAGIT